jgi:hypothetical protein
MVKLKGCKSLLATMLILSELTLYYFDYICAYRISTNLKQVISSDLAGPIPDWAEKVASQAQLKPSAPPSVQVSGKTA